MKLTQTLTFLSAAFVALSLIGCQKEDSDDAVKPVVKFEGKPDDALAGKYKTSDGTFTYAFEKDGKFTSQGKIKTPSGSMDTTVNGDWAISGSKLLIRDSKQQVASYGYEVKDKHLILILDGKMQLKTDLVRQN